MQVKKILISLTKMENSPYLDLEKQYNIKVDFKEFFYVSPVPISNLRKIRFDLNNYTAVIFTSKTAVDHYFRVSQEMRYNVPTTLKYFCINETISTYLSKYIVYRKRKIFFSDGNADNLIELISQNEDEKFLLPVSDTRKNTIVNKLKRKKINITPVVFYTLEYSDLKTIDINQYDLVVLFSPVSVKSIQHNFDDNIEKNIMIATFGKDTAKEALKAKLKVKIKAPAPDCPSMKTAIEKYLQNGKSI